MIKVDEEWEWYIGKLYTKLIKAHSNFEINTVVEFAPGFRHKIANALKDLNFKGTIYVIDSNEEAMVYIKEKYETILPSSKVICINKDFEDAIEDLPKQVDLFLANHSIDDMIIEEYLDKKDRKIAFDNTEISKKTLLDKWALLEKDVYMQDKIKNIIYLKWLKFFNSVDIKLIVMSQYNSNDYFMDNSYIGKITSDLFNRLKEFTSSDDEKIASLLNYYVKEDDDRFKDKYLMNNTQSARNWIVGKYNNNSKFDIPSSVSLMKPGTFINRKLYSRKEKLKPIYINEKLYEKTFDKTFDFLEASQNISTLFSLTIDKDKASEEELYSDAYIDFQSDASDIALNGNKGSGRAYYFGKNYNLKGEYTPLVTSNDPEYNNGKLPLSSAIHEAMISNVIDHTISPGCFKTLAIFDNGEKFKFIYENMVMNCGVMIRTIDDNDLYRFSHRFVNKIPYSRQELIEISNSFGVMEGNKFIDRLLHGAWSCGNLSIKSNMIDFDTAFYGSGRHPHWSFTNKYITNYFGYEHLGQIMILDSIVKSDLNIDGVLIDELKEIVVSKRKEQINKRFITLMGFEDYLYEKYKNKIDNLASEFERMSKLCFANYELLDVTKCSSNKCNIFDFSRFFRYFPILKSKDSILANYLLTLVNKEANLVESNIDESIKEVIDGYFKESFIKTIEEYLNVVLGIEKFINDYSDLYDYILDNEKDILVNEVISNAFVINTQKRYLGYDEALRFELLELYQNDIISNEQCHDIINMAIDSGCNKYIDLLIFEEGYFYLLVDKNGTYHYELKLYNKDLIDSDISILVNDIDIKVGKKISDKYLVLTSEEWGLKDIKSFDPINIVKVYVDKKEYALHPIGLESKKYYKDSE